jgi:predicted TIM-barrel fold metal-dependent hydrolase
MVDTHAHVFHRGLTFADTRRYAPAYDAPLDLYLQQLDQNGMTHGVLVQPSFLGTDNSYLVESIRTANGRLRGIAVVDPTISVNELSMLDKAGVVGIRLNLVGKRLPDLKTAEWTALLAGIRRLDWQVEVQRNAGDLAVLVPPLLDNGVQVVLDHFALPDPKLGVSDPGFAALLKLAASKTLWIKISGAYRNGPQGEAFAKQAYPMLRQSFGRSRGAATGRTRNSRAVKLTQKAGRFSTSSFRTLPNAHRFSHRQRLCSASDRRAGDAGRSPQAIDGPLETAERSRRQVTGLT